MSAVVDPRPLALARIGIGAAAFITGLELFVALQLVAGRQRIDFPTFLDLPVTAAALNVWLVICVLASVCMVAGLFSRTASAVMAGTVVWALLWDQQTYSSHVLLLAVLCLLLALGQPGAAFSLDARLHGPRRTISAWPQLLVMVQISVVYFFAAASKVNPAFLNGEVLGGSTWLPVPDATLPVVAVGAVATEFFLAVALWFRGTRRLAYLLGLGLHLAITVTLNLPLVLFAFSLLCLSCYPLFGARYSSRAATSSEPSPSVADR